MQRAEESVDSEWMNVVENLQHRIIQESQMENGDSIDVSDITIRDLREAALRHPEIAFWVKYNRARRGNLRVGDSAPNVSVRRAIDGKLTSLLARPSTDAGNASHRTVIVAGSLS
jgi:hypothetical protein